MKALLLVRPELLPFHGRPHPKRYVSAFVPSLPSVPINYVLAYIKPYIFSVLPAGSVPTHQADSPPPHHSFIQTAVIQVLSSLSLHPVQTLVFPFTPTQLHAPPAACSVRLMTPSPSAKSPLYFVTTPTDRSAAVEGSSIWMLTMRPWADQIDELVTTGQYADALALLDTIDQAVLLDKVKVIIHDPASR